MIARPQRRKPRLTRRLLAAGVAVLALLGGTREAAGQADAGPGQSERLVVRQLDFRGNESVTDLALANSIATTTSSWFARSGLVRWIGLGEKRYFNERDFQADVVRLQVFYRISGFPDVAVDTLVRRTEEGVFVTFDITEGRPIRVDSLTIAGTDSLPETVRRRLLTDLPLRTGDVFNRALMRASADSITRRLRDRGFPSADVYTSFESRAADRTATVTLQVVPGTRARISEITVQGNRRTDSSTIVALMTARPGRRYSEGDIFQSQRNLYSSDLFRYATINIDSAKFEPGSDSVPLTVVVAESKPQRYTGQIGYGTNDCFRANAGWTGRGLVGGGGRVVDLTARVSKVGVGRPTDWGLRQSVLCEQLAEDSIGSSKLNYNVTASWRRPAFLSPNNAITLQAYVERRSEFKVYLREEIGANISLTRETPRRRLPLALTYNLNYGSTQASRASFCAFLQACEPATVAQLTEKQRLATLTATGTIPRVNNPLDPTSGRNLILQTTIASKYLGSSPQLQFFRAGGEAAWYVPVGRGSVVSWRLRAGTVVAPLVDLGAGEPTRYVPPEQRFYGGGSNDVRGFRRGELGPVSYVVSQDYYQAVIDSFGTTDRLDSDSILVSPSGGNSQLLGSVELRVPSPFFRERLRLAVFVDAGSVWERGEPELGPFQLRVTPGVGLRVSTPLGPARLDVAYNPYRLQSGNLYVLQPDGGLEVVDPSFQLPDVRHWTVHFAVGQPF